ncbi:hypothetical protein EVG20_g1755 [Dentipellis fragilis]|uniref:Protein CPL1-like domain-containing protein n=1 Tax=Dentipellis fragilis TaxID=205917 RepID=A0A4Y9Z9N1_9AGAM|nr:hypothetical protein EVG20_g1755 [Dentipellis fragilis]
MPRKTPTEVSAHDAVRVRVTCNSRDRHLRRAPPLRAHQGLAQGAEPAPAKKPAKPRAKKAKAAAAEDEGEPAAEKAAEKPKSSRKRTAAEKDSGDANGAADEAAPPAKKSKPDSKAAAAKPPSKAAGKPASKANAKPASKASAKAPSRAGSTKPASRAASAKPPSKAGKPASRAGSRKPASKAEAANGDEAAAAAAAAAPTTETIAEEPEAEAAATEEPAARRRVTFTFLFIIIPLEPLESLESEPPWHFSDAAHSHPQGVEVPYSLGLWRQGGRYITRGLLGARQCPLRRRTTYLNCVVIGVLLLGLVLVCAGAAFALWFWSDVNVGFWHWDPQATTRFAVPELGQKRVRIGRAYADFINDYEVLSQMMILGLAYVLSVMLASHPAAGKFFRRRFRADIGIDSGDAFRRALPLSRRKRRDHQSAHEQIHGRDWARNYVMVASGIDVTLGRMFWETCRLAGSVSVTNVRAQPRPAHSTRPYADTLLLYSALQLCAFAYINLASVSTPLALSSSPKSYRPRLRAVTLLPPSVAPPVPPVAMRFIPALAAASALILPAVASSSRELHQFRQRGPLLDVCADLDAGLLINLGFPAEVAAKLDLCLCLSAFPLQLNVDLGLGAVIDLLGLNVVSALLEGIVGNGPTSQHCKYPPGATPICEAGNPCGFKCPPPLVPKGDQCVCAPPYSECNGKCGSFPKGCPSSVPRAKRETARLLAARGSPVTTLEQANAMCKPSETVCGSGTRGWECLDTTSNLESCGGCLSPAPFPGSESATGTDCSAIEAANRVQCLSGKCVVKDCKPGFVVNQSGDGCDPIPPALTSQEKRGDDSHKPSPPLIDLDVFADILAKIKIGKRDLIDVDALVAALVKIHRRGEEKRALIDIDALVKALVDVKLRRRDGDSGNVVDANILAQILAKVKVGNLIDVNALIDALVHLKLRREHHDLLDLPLVIPAAVNI